MQRIRLKFPSRTSKQVGSRKPEVRPYTPIFFIHSLASKKYCTSPLDNLYRVHQLNKTGSAFHRCCKEKTRVENRDSELEGNGSVSDLLVERGCHLFTLQESNQNVRTYARYDGCGMPLTTFLTSPKLISQLPEKTHLLKYFMQSLYI